MKTNITLSLMLLASVLIISGCAAEAAPVEPTVREVPISLASMKKGVVEHTYVSVGEVVPSKQVDIYVSGGGFIETVNVATGDRVEENITLIQLDDSEVDMTNYNATESQLRTVRDNLGAQVASLQDTYARQEALYNEGIITFLELDQTRSQLENLQREYSNARTAYSNQLTILKDGLDDQAESRVISSPVTGTVAAVYAKEGQAASGQIGLSIIDDSRIFVKTYISSELKKNLKIGDLVRIKPDGDDAEREIGTIHEIKSLPDPASKLFEMLIELESSDRWFIGDYAEMEFIIERYQATLVPTQAVLRSGTEQYIYLYEDGSVTRQTIEPGRTSGEWLEAANLETLSEVVVRGQNQLTSTSQIIVIEN